MSATLTGQGGGTLTPRQRIAEVTGPSPSVPQLSGIAFLSGHAYRLGAGDQASQNSSHGLRVRFRCPLPSGFMT